MIILTFEELLTFLYLVSPCSKLQLLLVCASLSVFYLTNHAVTFAVCFGSSSIRTVKCCLISFAMYNLAFILIVLSAATSSINTSDPVPLGAIHGHAITFPAPCLTDNAVWFRSWVFLSFILLSSHLVQVNLGFIWPERFAELCRPF